MGSAVDIDPAQPREGFDADVVILGAGIAGTLLATVLARAGVSVQVLDSGTHPRFAIGESTIPHTSTLFRLIAERYDVPEIKWLATFDNTRARVSAACGIKRGFNFLYHSRGEKQDPELSHQLPIPKIMHVENHFYRQDLDAWLLALAVRYGAKVRQGINITGIDLAENSVTVTSDGGESYRGRFLVDASGFRSPLARTLELRESPCRFRHHSRSLFTHMVGVPAWEKIAGKNLGPTPAGESTLHHVFDGGWIWVIPFNNHARSMNPLISVGLTVDPRRYPKPEDIPPAQEFRDFIDDFPDIRRHFAQARPVREWVGTDRLQYSSKQTVGHRWCLAMHAAGFLDPLFSRGLSFTMDFIHAFAWRLLDALKEDDFAVERFAHVERLQQGLLDYNDGLVANAYISFSSFDLWDRWIRIWALGELLALFESNRSYARYRASHDLSVLDRLEHVAPHGSLPDVPEVRSFFTWAYAQAAAVGAGGLTEQEAAQALGERLRQVGFAPPAFGITDLDNRFFLASPAKIPSTVLWAKRTAPEEIGTNLVEALALFARIRFDPREFDVAEEVKHHLAKAPLLGRLWRARQSD